MERKEGLFERAVHMLDMPGDAVMGLPRIELMGDREMRLEAHRGILAYGPEEICISLGRQTARVRGEGLELRSMNPTELLITGRVSALEFC